MDQSSSPRFLRSFFFRFGFFTSDLSSVLGVGIFAPTFSRHAIKFRVQFFNFVGILFREVVLLADVVFQVVEFLLAVFEKLDELTVAGVNGAGGFRPPLAGAGAEVAGEMPIDRIAV